MAESLKVSLEVDDQGTISTVTAAGTEFENLAESADEAVGSVARYEEIQERAGDSTKDFGKVLRSVFSDVDDISGKIGAAETLTEKFGVSLQELATHIDFGADNFGKEIREVQDRLSSAENATNELSNAFEGAEQSASSTSKNVADTSKNVARFDQILEKVNNTSQEFGDILRDVFSDVDDISGKVGAAETLTEEFDVSLQQLTTHIEDFGAEDFGSEIREVQDALSDAEDASNVLSNSFQKQAESSEQASEAEKVQKEVTEDVAESSRDAAEASEKLSSAQMEVVDSSSDAAEAIEQEADSQSNLVNEFFNATGAAERYRESLTGVSNRTEKTEQAIKDKVQALEISESTIGKNIVRNRQLAEVQENVSGRMTQMSKTSGHVNEILFSTGDAIQDVQFGMRGVGNNIAFMAENFVQAGAQVGGFRNVLKQVFAALKGPLGVIVAIQTLIALGPKIVKFFRDAEEGAGNLEDAIDGVGDSLISFNEEIQGIQVENVEQLREMKEIIEGRRDTQKEEVELLEELASVNDLHRKQVDAVSSLTADQRAIEKERLGLAGATTEEILARLEKEQTSLDILNDSVDSMDKQITQREVMKEAQEELKSATKDTADQVETIGLGLTEVVEIQETIIGLQEEIDFDTELEIDLFERATQEEIQQFLDKDLLNTLSSVGNAIDRVRKLQQNASGERLGQLNRLEQGLKERQTELQNVGLEGEKAFRTIDDVTNASINSINDAERALSFLENKFKETGSEEKRERIRQLKEEIRQLKKEMEGTTEQVGKFDTEFTKLEKIRLGVNAVQQGIEGLAQAFGQAAVGAKEFGDAAKQVLGSIGKLIGKQLIAQGTAMIAGSLFGDASKAAQGAILVGIGTSLVASSSALTASSGGGGGTKGESQELESGGEGGFRPGRQEGGPVEGGRLYRTHGLGEREFFVPESDGMIMTQNQLQSASTSQPQNVKVRTENRLEGSIEGPDLFELDTRLKEVEKFKKRFAEQ